ncbi:MAG: tripartite tricarboxylate transporter substrate binding protein [Betaproteobacteria bacterium]|nr:tripartite tricarboxylate transporter substrate binding protein [Betaproteobacteria bacterium]
MNRSVNMQGLLALAATAIMLLAPALASSQSYPSKPIRVIVPTIPGGSVDLIARKLGQKLSDAVGQPILVENPAGAAGVPGTNAVVRSAPDGHTLVFVTVGQVIGVIFLSKDLPYDSVRDLTPIIPAVEAITLVAVHPSIPGNTLRDVLDHARANPAKLAYGSTGIGSYFHLSIEKLKQENGVDMLNIPYKGMPPLMNDLAGGRIQFAFGAVASMAAFASRIKVIGTTDPKRWSVMPNVPAAVESVPGFEKIPTWYAFFAPAGLPRNIQMRINAELNKSLESSDVRQWVDENGMVGIGGSPEQLAAMHKKGIEVYGRIIKAAGIKPE